VPGNERRSSPRQECAVPLRFRVLADGQGPVAATCEGQAFNLSEHGVYFRSRDRVRVGQRLEMYFTLPRELAGRAPEQVRCTARVVHVEEETDQRGTTGVGAFVERFEPLRERRDWAN